MSSSIRKPPSNPLLYHIRTGVGRGYLTEKPLTIADYLPSEKPLPAPPAGVVADIVIPVYKGLAETRRCLKSVLAGKDPVRGDIIVVDDHSPEPKLSAWLDEACRLRADQAGAQPPQPGLRAIGQRRHAGGRRS